MSSFELTLGLCSVIQAEIWELVCEVFVFTIASQHFDFVPFGLLLLFCLFFVLLLCCCASSSLFLLLSCSLLLDFSFCAFPFLLFALSLSLILVCYFWALALFHAMPET